MQKDKLKIGLLYLSFHNSLKKIYGVNRVITKRDIMIKLGRQFLVPKPVRVLVIKELQKMNLLKEESKNEFRILDCDLNIEEDINKFFMRLNMFSLL